MDRKARFNLMYLIAAVMGVLMIQSFLATYGHMKAVPYSEFQQLLKEGRISEVAIGSDSLQGTLKESTASRPQHVIATRVDPSMIAQLERGSTPIARTLSRRPTMAARSVHVEAKEVQRRVQTGRC